MVQLNKVNKYQILNKNKKRKQLQRRPKVTVSLGSRPGVYRKIQAILRASRLKRRTIHTTQGEYSNNNNQNMAQKKFSDRKISPFVSKLVTILDDPCSSQCVKWIQPCSFVIVEPNSFSKSILPKYYKHHNLSSFIRQLNIYGFAKGKGDEYEYIYSNPNFLKNNQKRLRMIQRRAQPLIKAIKSDCESSLMEETSLTMARNLNALKLENEEYRQKNKIIQLEIDRLLVQRKREIENLTKFLCDFISNDFQLEGQQPESDEKQQQQYCNIVKALQDLSSLKAQHLVGSEHKIDNLIDQLTHKKSELEQSIRIKKQINEQNEMLCSFHSEDKKQQNMFNDNRLKEYNEYFDNNDMLFDYDCKDAQNFLDRIF